MKFFKLDEEFTYNIKSTVPVGATRFTFSDDLEDVLEVISCEVKSKWCCW